MKVLPVMLQVQDGVAHQLSGPVVGHVSATFYLVDLVAELAQCGRVVGQARWMCASAERDHVRVLHQKKNVAVRFSAKACLAQFALERQHVAVPAPSQVHRE